MEYLILGARVTDIERFGALEADAIRDPLVANEGERESRGIRRMSTSMTNAAEQRDRAGRANPYPKEYL